VSDAGGAAWCTGPRAGRASPAGAPSRIACLSAGLNGPRALTLAAPLPRPPPADPEIAHFARRCRRRRHAQPRPKRPSARRLDRGLFLAFPAAPLAAPQFIIIVNQFHLPPPPRGAYSQTRAGRGVGGGRRRRRLTALRVDCQWLGAVAPSADGGVSGRRGRRLATPCPAPPVRVRTRGAGHHAAMICGTVLTFTCAPPSRAHDKHITIVQRRRPALARSAAAR
jgi:hypothetical protein